VHDGVGVEEDGVDRTKKWLGLVGSGAVGLVMGEVQLSMTTAEARTSGLFGPFGEERTALVDLGDERQVERLSEVPERSVPGREMRPVLQRALKRWARWKNPADQWPAPLEGATSQEPEREENASFAVRVGSEEAGLDVYPVIHVQRIEPMRQ
jgi:hypothetical protein